MEHAHSAAGCPIVRCSQHSRALYHGVNTSCGAIRLIAVGVCVCEHGYQPLPPAHAQGVQVPLTMRHTSRFLEYSIVTVQSGCLQATMEQAYTHRLTCSGDISLSIQNSC